MGTINERHLLTLISMGNEQAFREIFDSYRNKLFNYVYRITDNEEIAEEIVMDAFLKIWTRRENLDKVENFDAYLYTIVRNKAFNAIKRVAHEATIITELGLTSAVSTECTEETIIYNESKAIFQQAVSQLPPQQKQVYILKHEGLKYEEIALNLNLSKNTVKAHLKKAVSSVKTAFSNYLLFFVSIGLPFLTDLDL